MFCIGCAGQMRAGKDTAADRLCQKLNEVGKKWKRAAFAANVKRVYCETFGVDLEFVEKWKVIPEPPPGFDMSVRQSLQFIGDGFRRIKGSIWLDLVFRDKTNSVVISDVRYRNEFRRVKQEGGLNVLVGRPGFVNDDPNGSEAEIRPYVVWALDNLKTGPVAPQLFRFAAIEAMGGGVQSAPPEGTDLFDYFVCNDGTKEQLYEKIDTQLVHYVQEFVFKFPELEDTCLISN